MRRSFSRWAVTWGRSSVLWGLDRKRRLGYWLLPTAIRASQGHRRRCMGLLVWPAVDSDGIWTGGRRGVVLALGFDGLAGGAGVAAPYAGAPSPTGAPAYGAVKSCRGVFIS